MAENSILKKTVHVCYVCVNACVHVLGMCVFKSILSRQNILHHVSTYLLQLRNGFLRRIQDFKRFGFNFILIQSLTGWPDVFDVAQPTGKTHQVHQGKEKKIHSNPPASAFPIIGLEACLLTRSSPEVVLKDSFLVFFLLFGKSAYSLVYNSDSANSE